MYEAYCGGDENPCKVVSEFAREIADELDADNVDEVASALTMLMTQSAAGGELGRLSPGNIHAPGCPCMEPPSGALLCIFEDFTPPSFNGKKEATAAEEFPRYTQLPEGVKAMFNCPTDEFFLILLLKFDSSSFMQALVPRLSATLHGTLASRRCSNLGKVSLGCPAHGSLVGGSVSAQYEGAHKRRNAQCAQAQSGDVQARILEPFRALLRSDHYSQ